MAPTRTRARPTGREPRATAAKKDAPVTAAESGTPKKRGRGRPPKNGVSKVVKLPSGRPRGRPPKDPSELKPKKAATGTGRGRGRPAATTPKKGAATPKKAASASKSTGSAKSQRSGRKGRKSDVATAVEPEANGAYSEDKEDKEDDVEEPIAQDDSDIDLGAVADVDAGRLDGDESPMDSDVPAEDD